MANTLQKINIYLFVYYCVGLHQGVNINIRTDTYTYRHKINYLYGSYLQRCTGAYYNNVLLLSVDIYSSWLCL